MPTAANAATKTKYSNSIAKNCGSNCRHVEAIPNVTASDELSVW